MNLLPCPFCGSPAEFEYTEWDETTETGDDGTGCVQCTGCQVTMPGLDREEAEERWNRRVNATSERGE